MNWQHPVSGEDVQIAIIRLPARVPITDPRYGGAVLIGYGIGCLFYYTLVFSPGINNFRWPRRARN